MCEVHNLKGNIKRLTESGRRERERQKAANCHIQIQSIHLPSLMLRCEQRRKHNLNVDCNTNTAEGRAFWCQVFYTKICPFIILHKQNIYHPHYKVNALYAAWVGDNSNYFFPSHKKTEDVTQKYGCHVNLIWLRSSYK